MGGLELSPVGRVASPLRDRAAAPKQGDEGAPAAWLIFDSRYAEALTDLRAGTEALVLTWLDQADRSVLRVHPRDDLTRPLTGVFSTRSSDRPNPIGLHRVRVLEVDGLRVRVADLEAIDGDPGPRRQAGAGAGRRALKGGPRALLWTAGGASAPA